MEIIYSDETLVVDGVSRPGIPFLRDASMESVGVVNEYLYYMGATRGASPDTTRTYAADLCDFFAFLERDGIPWDRVAPNQIVAWRDTQSKVRKLTVSTVNQRVRAAGRFYKWAVVKGRIASHPFGTRRVAFRGRYGLAGPGASDKPAYEFTLRGYEGVPRILNLEQAKTFTHALRPRRNQLMAWLMFETGLRRSEVTYLQTAVLPHVARVGKEEMLVHCGKGKMHRMVLNPRVTHTKGGKERWVEISQPLVEELREYIDGERARLAKVYRDRHGVNPPDYVFLGASGAPLSRTHLNNAFKDASRRCGIPCTPHVIRHTYGTYELLRVKEKKSATEALLWVQERMGHFLLKDTLRYLHLAEHVGQKTMDKHQEEVSAMFKGALRG